MAKQSGITDRMVTPTFNNMKLSRGELGFKCNLNLSSEEYNVMMKNTSKTPRAKCIDGNTKCPRETDYFLYFEKDKKTVTNNSPKALKQSDDQRKLIGNNKKTQMNREPRRNNENMRVNYRNNGEERVRESYLLRDSQDMHNSQLNKIVTKKIGKVPVIETSSSYHSLSSITYFDRNILFIEKLREMVRPSHQRDYCFQADPSRQRGGESNQKPSINDRKQPKTNEIQPESKVDKNRHHKEMTLDEGQVKVHSYNGESMVFYGTKSNSNADQRKLSLEFGQKQLIASGKQSNLVVESMENSFNTYTESFYPFGTLSNAIEEFKQSMENSMNTYTESFYPIDPISLDDDNETCKVIETSVGRDLQENGAIIENSGFHDKIENSLKKCYYCLYDDYVRNLKSNKLNQIEILRGLCRIKPNMNKISGRGRCKMPMADIRLLNYMENSIHKMMGFVKCDIYGMRFYTLLLYFVACMLAEEPHPFCQATENQNHNLSKAQTRELHLKSIKYCADKEQQANCRIIDVNTIYPNELISYYLINGYYRALLRRAMYDEESTSDTLKIKCACDLLKVFIKTDFGVSKIFSYEEFYNFVCRIDNSDEWAPDE